MTTESKIALGIVGALAAGVVIGLLVAPEKGSETRKKVKDTTGKWMKSLGQLFGKIQDDGILQNEGLRRQKETSV